MKLKVILSLMILSLPALAQVKTENFIIQIQDRSMSVVAPDKRKAIYSVLVENRSLSDQLGKFTVQGKILKYVSVKSGVTEPVEIENKTSANVVFVPVSPAFQEVELLFGKKAYEIPSKK